MAATLPRLVLLPGMDGTGVLFRRLTAALPPAPEPLVVSYPTHEPLGLDGLVAFVEPRLPQAELFVLAGESFSGPVAVRLAARRPPGLAGLALVATFVRYPPVAALLWRALVHDFVLGVSPPAALIRGLLTGWDAPAPLVDEVRDAVASVAPAAMAARLRAVLTVDLRDGLKAVAVPVLYLAGRRDRLVGKWAMNQVCAACPDAQAVVLDAAHLVLQRRPAEAAAVLTAFARRCEAAAEAAVMPG